MILITLSRTGEEERRKEERGKKALRLLTFECNRGVEKGEGEGYKKKMSFSYCSSPTVVNVGGKRKWEEGGGILPEIPR